jgi:hypothetical protein
MIKNRMIRVDHFIDTISFNLMLDQFEISLEIAFTSISKTNGVYIHKLRETSLEEDNIHDDNI